MKKYVSMIFRNLHGTCTLETHIPVAEAVTKTTTIGKLRHAGKLTGGSVQQSLQITSGLD